MYTEQKYFILIMVVIVLMIILAILTFDMGMNYGYERGQIDALNGKWKYEMQIDTMVTPRYTEVTR